MKETQDTMESADILIISRSLFKKMKDLAEKQENLIFDDQIDEFNNLLNQREQIRKEITANTGEYESGIKNIPTKRLSQKVLTLSQEISDVIRSIQETDKRIEELIISKKDIFMNDVKNIRKGQNAVRSYGGVRQKINKFIDRNG
jgi:seryl-tRNA synthetase